MKIERTSAESGEKIVEAEIFSVDERITIINEIFAITGKEDEEST